MQILFVGNGNYKHKGSGYYNPERKIVNGLIRNGHNVYFFSDRDVARSSNIFGSSKTGKKQCNKDFITTCKNFAPDMILMCFADIITRETILTVRQILPNVKIAQFNVDPIFRDHNTNMLNSKLDLVDATFITTAGRALSKFHNDKGPVCFVPNASDSSIEWPKCFENDNQENDIFWAQRPSKHHSDSNPRIAIPSYLEQSGKVKIDYYGMNGKPALMSANYYKAINNCKMGLNLSVDKEYENSPISSDEERYLYSSDRIAHYVGSGLLTLCLRGNKIEEMFEEDKEMVFFDRKEELLEKVLYYKANPKKRMEIAYNGWKKQHEKYNEKLVANFITDVTMTRQLSQDYAWPTEFY